MKIFALLIFISRNNNFLNIKKTKNTLQKKVVRKEIRDLTTEEWINYKKSFLNLKKHGLLDEITKLHIEMANYAHNSIYFLHWHRALLLHFEELLRVVNNDKTLSVPYWDWTLDANDPMKSIIFNKDYWGFEDCFEVMVPNKHCLLRSKDLDPVYNKLQIKKLLNKKYNFKEFSEEFELVPHAIVHFNIGGDNGDMSNMWSVNDPIFWHHHSFCDLLFHKKQLKGLKTDKSIIDHIVRPFNISVKNLDNLDDLGISYKTFKKPKLLNCDNNPIPKKISALYAERHGYDLKKIRKVEDFMVNPKSKKGFITRILEFLFCLSN